MEINSQSELKIEGEELKRWLATVGDRLRRSRYGLAWVDMPEAFGGAGDRIPVLAPVPEKNIVNDDGKPTHILIEGDNYHALTCLNYTHKGKVDLIYIDPPYNTGSDGFRYMDRRVLDKFPHGVDVPKDHPQRHSYWLSFMDKRLKLARNLLKDDGVIFISINEEEYAQLKLLCDSIFLPSNYLASFTVKVRHADRILKGDKDYHETTEQLLLYRKSPAHKTVKRLRDNTSVDKYVYRIEELVADPEVIELGGKQVQVFKPGQYAIHKGEPDADKFQKVNIRGSIKEGNSSGRFHMRYLEARNDRLGYLYKVPDMGEDKFPYRYFLTREKQTLRNGSYFQGVPVGRDEVKEVPYPDYLDFEEEFNNVGPEGGVVFRNGKKPVDFLKFVISMGTLRKDAVILDFFAGSGSTGHAVMQLNSLDGGTRQAILCTNNEGGIAQEVTYPRLRNVICGYRQDANTREVLFDLPLNAANVVDNTAILTARDTYFSAGFEARYDQIREEVRRDRYTITGIVRQSRAVPGLGNSLRYYRIALAGEGSVLTATDDDKLELARKAGYLLSVEQGTFEEVESTPYYQLFRNSRKLTAVYFREELDQLDEFVRKIESSALRASVYLFCWGARSDFEAVFETCGNVALKVLPQPIIEAYKNIYNPA